MILSLSIYAGVFRAAYYGHELRPYNFSIKDFDILHHIDFIDQIASM